MTRRFYEHLFSKYPQTRAMFHRTSAKVHEKMLASALAAVVEHLEDTNWLVSTLGPMGERHAGYGVTPEMYGWVGDALMTTLREVAGADWTPALEQAWTDAYGAIASLMQARATAA